MLIARLRDVSRPRVVRRAFTLYVLGLRTHIIQVKDIVIVVIAILIVRALPVAALKHRAAGGVLGLAGFVLGGFLVQSVFLPFGKGLLGDRREVFAEFVPLGFEEFFEREGFEG